MMVLLSIIGKWNNIPRSRRKIFPSPADMSTRHGALSSSGDEGHVNGFVMRDGLIASLGRRGSQRMGPSTLAQTENGPLFATRTGPGDGERRAQFTDCIPGAPDAPCAESMTKLGRGENGDGQGNSVMSTLSFGETDSGLNPMGVGIGV
jgi:hypothetical protein